MRLAGFRNSLLAREFIGEFAEAGGVTRARQAVLPRIAGAHRKRWKARPAIAR